MAANLSHLAEKCRRKRQWRQWQLISVSFGDSKISRGYFVAVMA
jgi:hypothetical protein